MANGDVIHQTDVLRRLMERYDVRFPNATPFQRGTVESEYRRTLADLYEIRLHIREWS
jgi:hypothetical protein